MIPDPLFSRTGTPDYYALIRLVRVHCSWIANGLRDVPIATFPFFFFFMPSHKTRPSFELHALVQSGYLHEHASYDIIRQSTQNLAIVAIHFATIASSRHWSIRSSPCFSFPSVYLQNIPIPPPKNYPTGHVMILFLCPLPPSPQAAMTLAAWTTVVVGLLALTYNVQPVVHHSPL